MNKNITIVTDRNISGYVNDLDNITLKAGARISADAIYSEFSKIGSTNNIYSNGSFAVGSNNIAGIGQCRIYFIDSDKKIYLNSQVDTSQLVIGENENNIKFNGNESKFGSITEIGTAGADITAKYPEATKYVKFNALPDRFKFGTYNSETHKFILTDSSELVPGSNMVCFDQTTKSVYASIADDTTYTSYHLEQYYTDNATNQQMIQFTSHPAVGDDTVPGNTYAVAEGQNCKAYGTYSHAEGRNCIAQGSQAHAEGRDTYAEYACHAQNRQCSAFGYDNFAGGVQSVVRNGDQFPSFAFGYHCHAESDSSMALGYLAKADLSGSFVWSSYDTNLLRSKAKTPNSFNIYVKNGLNDVYVNETSLQDSLVDYTAFEVFPTNKEISSGYNDSLSGLSAILGWDITDPQISSQNFTNETYSVAVPSCDTVHLRLRSSNTIQSQSDIMIDWGDDTEPLIIKNHNFSGTDEDKYEGTEIYVNHKYKTPNRKYIVRVYGRDYMLLRGYVSNSYENIISRVIDPDLRFSSNLTNASSICLYSKRILKIQNDDGYNPLNNVINFASMFNGCQNLKSVNVAYFFSKNIIYSATSMFKDCINLTSLSNFRLPSLVQDETGGDRRALAGIFNNCQSLNAYVDDILPLYGFAAQKLYLTAFKDCKKIKIRDYDYVANILWNNTTTTFGDTWEMFKNCESLDLTKIPINWGGSANQTIIIDKIPQINNKINTINSNVSTISNAVTSLDARVTNLENGGYPANPLFVEKISDKGYSLVYQYEKYNHLYYPKYNMNNNTIEMGLSVSAGLEFKIPLNALYQASEKLMTIDWGDGNYDVINNNFIKDYTHTYVNAGNYLLRISGLDDFFIKTFYYSDDKTFYDFRSNITSIKLVGNGYLQNSMSRYRLFCNMNNITTVDLYNSGIKVLDATFCSDDNYSSTKLSSIIIPKGLKYVYDKGTFMNCSSLTEIVFPETFVTMDAVPDTFKGCSSLMKIEITNKNTVVEIKNTDDMSKFIEGTPEELKIIVPDNLYNSYIVDSKWSTVASHIVKKSES